QHPDQRNLVIKQLRRTTGPALIAGDFNVSNRNSLVSQFGEIGFQTVQTEEITWRHRPYVLDHIFYSPHLRPLSYNVKPTKASDHHILIAEFEFQD
ncbi:MAG: endonuclease/exonuclease/phosphatase family protein, partial [Gallionellaceae bacterium]|nr:endonuclease/exonuclease/phosphatase family protein [Gallionellaceae bacterium]